MYLCEYVHMCVYLYVCIYIYIHRYVHIYIYTHTHTSEFDVRLLKNLLACSRGDLDGDQDQICDDSKLLRFVELTLPVVDTIGWKDPAVLRVN